MASIGVLGSESPVDNVLLPSELVTSVSAAERLFPKFEIKLDGKTMQDLKLTGFFMGLELEEETEAIPRLLLTFSNANSSLIDVKAFREGTVAEVKIGYKPDQMVDHGSFVMDSPEFRYSSSSETPDTLEFIGYNNASKLARDGQKQRVFENKKDSEIVEEIAKEYGFETDIEETDYMYPHVLQASETDLQFIRRRARLYGYQLYLDKNKLHFHPVQFVNSGKEISRGGGDSVVKELTLRIDTFLHAFVIKKSQVEWERLRVLSEESQEEDDKLFAEAKKQDNKLKSAKDIVGDPQLELFLIGEGHLQNTEELKRQTEAFSVSSRWLAEIEMKTLGLEFMRAGVVVRMKGIGRFDGPWLATKVRHRSFSHLDAGDSYATHFILKRSFSKIGEDTVDGSSTDITESMQSESLVGVG